MPDLFLLASLNNFVNQLWVHGPIPPGFDFVDFDLISIAERARAGERFYCHVYALALVELAQALGYHGRLLSLSADGKTPAHAVAEIWVNDLGRWVLFDPDFNLFYGSPEHPLDVLEVRRAYLSGEVPTLWPGDDPATVSLGPEQTRLAPLYRNVEWHFRDDYWSNRYFPGHPNRSDANSVVWDDPARSPVLTFKPTASSRKAVYFDPFRWGLAPLDIDRGATLTARVYLSYPGFAKGWIEARDGTLLTPPPGLSGAPVRLPLVPGDNRFRLIVESNGGARVSREFGVRFDPPGHGASLSRTRSPMLSKIRSNLPSNLPS